MTLAGASIQIDFQENHHRLPLAKKLLKNASNRYTQTRLWYFVLGKY